jgi:hypothetical protein
MLYGGLLLVASLTPSLSFTGGFHFQQKSAQLRTSSVEVTSWQKEHATATTTTTSLSMSNQFDLSKPTFDPFSLRSVRNDALLQYSSLNQSEPLRINLYLILAVSLFSFPTLSEAVIGEEAQLPAVVLSTLGGIGSVALFVKECQSRARQLNRIEKELNSESLRIKLSTNNKFQDSLYSQQPTYTLKDLKGKKRVLAVCGSKDQLKDVVRSCRVFRRRLAQAGTVVAFVCTDDVDDRSNSSMDLKELGIQENEIRSGQWLGQIQGTKEWTDYCQGLVDEGNSNDLIWFGLNYNGRSFASARGESPRLLEILGQNLRPVDFLDESDADESTVGFSPADASSTDQILQCQKKFYDALTKGVLEEMTQICSTDQAQEVTEILDAGGRIDSWESCLAEGARPADMSTSSSDVLLISPTKAYSTCIEFPVNTGGYSDPSGATLLAVQEWARSNEKEEWKLTLHQTIPWSPDTRAGGTLRCDGRGCVALTRGEEKRTFGGLIG